VSTRPVTRPVTLSAAAAVEALEGIALVAVGLYVGVEAIAGSPNDLTSAVVLALMAIAAGVGVVAVGRGLWQARRWGRAPALLTQIFAVIAAISMIQSRRQAVGVVVIVLAVAGAASLLSPPSTRALDDE
jgi:predicted alternative tryptophan synthase beta-subunit